MLIFICIHDVIVSNPLGKGYSLLAIGMCFPQGVGILSCFTLKMGIHFKQQIFINLVSSLKTGMGKLNISGLKEGQGLDDWIAHGVPLKNTRSTPTPLPITSIGSLSNDEGNGNDNAAKQ